MTAPTFTCDRCGDEGDLQSGFGRSLCLTCRIIVRREIDKFAGEGNQERSADERRDGSIPSPSPVEASDEGSDQPFFPRPPTSGVMESKSVTAPEAIPDEEAVEKLVPGDPQPAAPSLVERLRDAYRIKHHVLVHDAADRIENLEAALASDGRPVDFTVKGDSVKMLRETFCVAQGMIGGSDDPRRVEHSARLQRLCDICDEHRPLGPDGKHGSRRCTPTCGCEDKPYGIADPDPRLIPLPGGRVAVAAQDLRVGDVVDGETIGRHIDPWGFTDGTLVLLDKAAES